MSALMNSDVLTPKQAEKLEAALAMSAEPAAAVLRVLLVSGLQIGDVLAIEKRSLRATVKKRPNYESHAWAELKLRWSHGASCAEAVCVVGLGGPRAGYCAYQRCRRFLAALSRQLKLGHVNLQTLRRTAVVRLLQDGVAPEDVQKRLGFKTLRGVQYYVARAKRKK